MNSDRSWTLYVRAVPAYSFQPVKICESTCRSKRQISSAEATSMSSVRLFGSSVTLCTTSILLCAHSACTMRVQVLRTALISQISQPCQQNRLCQFDRPFQEDIPRFRKLLPRVFGLTSLQIRLHFRKRELCWKGTPASSLRVGTWRYRPAA